MFFQNKKYSFNHLKLIEKVTFLLILFLPLSFFLGPLIVNLILTLFFVLYLYLNTKTSKKII